MPTVTEYDTDSALTQLVNEMVSNQTYGEFKSLRDNEVVILACYADRQDKESGEPKPVSGGPVKLLKVPPVYRPFMKHKPHYILLVDKNAWAEMQDVERQARIHQVIWQVEASPSDDGEIKLKSRKPDIVTNLVTARRFGSWNKPMSDLYEYLNEGLRGNAHRLVPKSKAGDAEVEGEDEGEKQPAKGKPGKAAKVKPSADAEPAEDPENANEEEERPRVQMAKMPARRSNKAPEPGDEDEPGEDKESEPARPTRKAPAASAADDDEDDEPQPDAAPVRKVPRAKLPAAASSSDDDEDAGPKPDTD